MGGPLYRLLISSRSINGYRREEFLKSANQKQDWPMAAMFVNGSEGIEQ
jgi:hypothetical protein